MTSDEGLGEGTVPSVPTLSPVGLGTVPSPFRGTVLLGRSASQRPKEISGRSKPTTVYRLRDAKGALLYVGIAGNPGRRFEQHAGEKPWWGEVCDITLEHYADRGEAMRAEMVAIKSERPRYNIVGNGVGRSAPATTPGAGWDFELRRHSGGRRANADLRVMYEVNTTSMSDEWLSDEISAEDLFWKWCALYAPDLGDIPIFWFVEGGGTFEGAPFTRGNGDDFLTHFTWPRRNGTGEMLNWQRLPIEDGRWGVTSTKGGFFQEFTGYKPTYGTPSVNLTDLLRTMGYEP